MLAVSMAVYAETPKILDTGAPIQVYARTIEMNDRTGVTIYRDEVSIIDGPLSIDADLAKTRMKKGEIQTFSAFGKPVVINHVPVNKRKKLHATAARVEYHVESQQLEMFGDVRLKQEGSELRCPELKYDLKAGRFAAKSGSNQRRCSIFIAPRTRSHSSSEEEKNKK